MTGDLGISSPAKAVDEGEFEFVEKLPSTVRTRGRTNVYRRFREALRERPGVWAKYPAGTMRGDSGRFVVYHVKRSHLYVGYEAVVSDCAVYVRYIGATTVTDRSRTTTTSSSSTTPNTIIREA